MTLYAKTAAVSMVEDPEEREEPAWRRALPWVAGAAALGGLGYAGWKSTSPPAQGPGLIANTLGVVGKVTDSAGGALSSAVGSAVAAGAGKLGWEGWQKKRFDSGKTDYSTHEVLSRTERAATDRKPTWLGEQAGLSDPSHQTELNSSAGRINALSGNAGRGPTAAAPLMSRLKAENIQVRPKDFAEHLDKIGRDPSYLAGLAPEQIAQAQRLGVLDATGKALGTTSPTALGAEMLTARTATGAHALTAPRMLGRAARFGGATGVAVGAAAILAGLLGNKSVGE